MAVLAGKFIPVFKGARVASQSLWGVVTVSGVPVERTILVYTILNGTTELAGTTTSDPTTGIWSISVKVIDLDTEFRVICIGGVDENSLIYEHVPFTG